MPCLTTSPPATKCSTHDAERLRRTTNRWADRAGRAAVCRACDACAVASRHGFRPKAAPAERQRVEITETPPATAKKENAMVDFVMSVRGVSGGAFDETVGATRFLIVPDNVDPAPVKEQIRRPADWYAQVIANGKWTNDDGKERGDILFIVHGYNTSVAEAMSRHRQIKQGLAANHFKGVVVSFDWPCGTDALAYLVDRHRAKMTAFKLVDDGIWQLSARQTPDCPINIHVLGHSTGAYVIREAFDDADDSQVPHSAWLVSQIL